MGPLAVIAAGIAALFGLAALLNRLGDAKPRVAGALAGQPGAEVPATTVDDLERELELTLPASCAQFLRSPRPEYSDDVAIRPHLAEIVELTKEYRAGYGGASPWPREFVCLGDQADACPYALNCATGVVVQTDHGELNRPPIQRFGSFDEFVATMRSPDYEDEAEED